MMSRRVRGLFFSFLTILLAACGGDGANDTVVTPPLATEVVVSPSAQSQDVMVSGVRVTIPSGLLQTPQTLQIVPISQTPVNPPMPDMETVGLYNISFLAAQTFDKPLVIEFPYDASALGSDAADGKNLWVSYLDEVRNEWVRVEATVDKTRQKIAVTTDHLSTWWIYQLRGYDYVPKGRATYFEVYYKPTHANPREDVKGQSTQGLAEDVLAALETARTNYKSNGFKVSDGTITVLVGDVPDSSWGKWGGSIDIKRSTLINLARVKGDGAHELFHSVENRYYFTGEMGMRYWLMEGTPDFMAYQYGWNKTIPADFEALNIEWFNTSLFGKTKDVEAYPLAHFLRYLSDERGVDIKKLWDFIASSWTDAPGAFRTNVAAQTGKLFDDVWKDFVLKSMFGPGKLAENRSYFFSLTKSATEVSKTTTLSPGHTAKLLKTHVDTCDINPIRAYQFSIETAATGSWQVELWSTTPEGHNPVLLGMLYAGKKEITNLQADSVHDVFALIYNTGSSDVNLTLKLAAPGCPIITSLLPSSGGSGTQVTIMGRGFGTPDAAYATNNYNLKFSGVSYGLGSSWTDTQIVFSIGTGATTGDVIVTAGGKASAPARFIVAEVCSLYDPLYGLTWPLNGNSAGEKMINVSYADAKTWAEGASLCGITSGWRLPTRDELLNAGPMLRKAPFFNVNTAYWTSESCMDGSYAGGTLVFLADTTTFCARYSSSKYGVWPVVSR